MKKQVIFYSIIGIIVLIFAIGFFLSQYVEYKQFQLSQQKAIEDCVEKKSIRPDASGYEKSRARLDCTEIYSQ
jgi:hypothetical protein